jgi:hypothetical protein
MLYEEAQWVGKVLIEKTMEGNRILNLGSSTLDSRTKLQPHMEEFIFAPLRDKNVQVVHSDITFDEGVDLQGDFTDPAFIAQLKNIQFEGVMCCNLFEHLENRSLLIDALNEIIPINGLLLITVPFQYPYHLDPIDTLYRPNVSDLIKTFPNFTLISDGTIKAQRQVFKKGKIRFHKNYFELLKDDPKLFIRLIIRVLLPFYKYKMWLITYNDLKSMFKPFSATGVLLRRC